MRPKIFVEDSYEAMSKRAASIFAGEVKLKPSGVFGFATGSTPVKMYEELVAQNIDFANITTFNLDEYYPIKKESAASYHYFMDKHLFEYIKVKATNIPCGQAKDPDAECAAYEQKITHSGGIDMQILGLGHNGHIGFNEPGDFFPEKTHCVKLAESTIQANSRHFAKGEEMPAYALTMGIGTIMLARKILLLISGESKSEITYRFLHDNISPKIPATILRLHSCVTLVMDKEAAQKCQI